ncbi:MAG: ABC transporter ATP-binding protein [bacterium]|nr:ABC transporter ATP-binding protein [bacterium]
MMNVLEVRDLNRGFGGRTVLGNLGLTVESGEVVGLLGRNGAGKTTLIRLIMGMLAPNQGTVRVFGLDPRQDPVAVRRRIGFVAEDQELPAFMTVGRVLDLHRELFPDWQEEAADDLLARFELPVGRKISDLSRGQARQVALLCAVSHRPELLILDEPAGGLDPVARREFLETSIRLLNETGTTILFSSHHMGDVERMASRLVMIHETQKWIDSPLDDIREGYCLALVPAGAVPAATMLALEDCLCVRERGPSLHAVFARDAESCTRELEKNLGLTEAACRPLSLEDMFLELAGRDA